MTKLPTVGTTLRYRHKEHGDVAAIATSNAYDGAIDTVVDIAWFNTRAETWVYDVYMPFREDLVWWPG